MGKTKEVIDKVKEKVSKPNPNKTIADKFNKRLSAMKNSGEVDMDYIQTKLEKFGVPLTKNKTLSSSRKATYTGDMVRFLEELIPKGGRSGYSEYGKKIEEQKEEERKYEENRQKHLAEQAAISQSRMEIDSLLEEYFEALYGISKSDWDRLAKDYRKSTGKKDYSADYGDIFKGYSETKKERIESMKHDVLSDIANNDYSAEEVKQKLMDWFMIGED